MADKIHRVKYDISAQNRASAAFNEIKRSMNDVERAGAALRTALGTLGVGISVAGIAAFAKSGIDAADNLGKLAQKVGVSVESLSAFQYAAQLSDVSAEELSAGLARLARAADEASTGSNEASRAFEKLGVNVKGADGNLRSTEELLLDIADRFSKLEDGTQKTALAMQIFGRAGAELIPLLNGGRAGFEELRKEAERLGIVIDTQTAKAAEAFNDNLTRVGKQVDALKYALAEVLLPSLEKVAESMAKAAKEGGVLKSVMAGIQTLLTGDDTYKFNKQLTDTVNALFVQQRRLEEMKASRLYTAEEIEIQAQAVRKLREEAEKLQQIKPIIAPEPPPTPERPRSRGGASSTRTSSRDTGEAERRRQEAEAERQRKAELAEYLRQSAVYEERRQAEIDAMAEYYQWLGRENQRRVESAEAIRRQLDPTIELTEKTQELADLINKGFLTEAEGQAAFDKLYGDFAQAQEGAKGLTKELKRQKDIGDELGLVFVSAFEDAVIAGKKFSDVLKAVGQDITRLVLRKTVTEPAADAISGFIKDLDIGKILGRASGGPVSAGRTYLVGEDGPELLTMGASSGYITPNHALGGGGVNIVQHISVDSRSDRASVIEAMNQAKEIAKAEILRSMRYGGTFARASNLA